MDNGAIVESGTHNQLLANNGIYARLNAISYAVESTNGHTTPSAALTAPAGGAEDAAEDN